MPCAGFPSESCGGYKALSMYVLTGTNVEGGPSRSLEPSDPVAPAEPEAENYVGCYKDDKTARALKLASIDHHTMSVEVSSLWSSFSVVFVRYCGYPFPENVSPPQIHALVA